MINVVLTSILAVVYIVMAVLWWEIFNRAAAEGEVDGCETPEKYRQVKIVAAIVILTWPISIPLIAVVGALYLYVRIFIFIFTAPLDK